MQCVARDMIAPAMPHTRSLPLSLRFPNVHLAPRGPVPAQLEEIIEVREAKCLELLGEIAECIGIMERPDGDQLALHPEFGIGEIVARIELRTHQTSAFERALPDQHCRRIGRNRERHERKVSQRCELVHGTVAAPTACPVHSV